MSSIPARNAYYVTTPIYYVNDVPHIGHAYTSIAADVLARFYRLRGDHVFFLTGTDEHGQKVEKAAQKAGMSPQEFVDKVSQRFQSLSQTFNLTPTEFIRTTQPHHKQAAQALWEQLVKNGQIYKGAYAGWYSVRDEAYYQDNELVEGKAPTGADVEWVEEPSYFFRLSHWQEPLLKYYEDHPEFIGPESRRNEVIRFVERGLKDLSISRSTFRWGVPVPGDPDHVMYVWLDALTNYITALNYPNIEHQHFQLFWPQAIHLVGKDILRFHAIYWPAFLLAAQIPVPKRIFAHGWLTMEGQKMSKSLGNTLDPFKLVETYGVDQLRYFLMREIPFGGDGSFSHQAFIRRINSDLANDFGNLVQRVLSFIHKHANGCVPTPDEQKSQDQALLKQACILIDQLIELAEQQKLHKMCEQIWALVSAANRYIDAEQPWSLRKTDQKRMGTVLYTLAETIRHVAVMASPIIPEAASKVLDQLAVGQEDRDFSALQDKALMPGTPLPEPFGVFPRVQDPLLTENQES